MKVLVGIDGSDRSYAALRFASGLLSSGRDELVLYFSPPVLKLASSSEITDELRQIAQDAVAIAVFERAQEFLCPGFARQLKTVVGTTRAAEGILAAAANEEANLIVVGSHGTAGRLQFVLGSTARSVAHQAHVPVLVVREQPKEKDCGSGPLRILIGCDDQELWRHAAEHLRHFTWPSATQATLLHVIETMDEDHVKSLMEHYPSVPDSWAREYRESMKSQARDCQAAIEKHRSDLPNLVAEAKIEVAQGHVVEQMIDKVQRESIDMVVVGAHNRGRIGRLLGSTTEALLAQCPCALLIIHEPAKA